MKSVNVYTSTDGVEVASVDYNLSDLSKKEINIALLTFREDPNILECQIDGFQVWSEIKLFDSTIDDKDRNELKRGSFDDFTSDIQRFIIKRSGAIVFKAYSKYSDDFLTFDIE